MPEVKPTHEIRILINCPKDEDVLQWYSLITDARYRNGCVCASMEPIPTPETPTRGFGGGINLTND